MVTFSQNNLLNIPPAGGPFDIIFLRNVLIYFDLETRAKVPRSVRGVLAPDGFLMLGAVETTAGIDDVWARVSVGRGSVYCISRTAAA
jgi:chemotaxis protein methyltransferase CheR